MGCSQNFGILSAVLQISKTGRAGCALARKTTQIMRGLKTNMSDFASCVSHTICNTISSFCNVGIDRNENSLIPLNLQFKVGGTKRRYPLITHLSPSFRIDLMTISIAHDVDLLVRYASAHFCERVPGCRCCQVWICVHASSSSAGRRLYIISASS